MSINENEIDLAAKSLSELVSAEECEWIKEEIYEGTPETAFAMRFKNHALLSIHNFCQATGLKRKEVLRMITEGTLDHFVVNKQVKIPLDMDWFCRHIPRDEIPTFQQMQEASLKAKNEPTQ